MSESGVMWGIVERYGTRAAMLYFILYVFGHNTRAWALYEKMGYAVVNATMDKKSGGSE